MIANDFLGWLLSCLPVVVGVFLVAVISIIVDVIWGKEQDPAQETYFYWRGDWWANLKGVCRDTIGGNLRDAGWLFAKAASVGMPWKIMWKTGGVVVILASFLFLPVFLVPFTIVFIIVFALYNVLALTVGTVSTLILKIHGIFVLCPHCSCNVKMPMYKCLGCGQEHRRLKPMARYGVLRRKCDNPSCGVLIPTTWLSGKRTLKSFCSECGGELHSSEAVPMTLAFIGGRSSGKSFLMMDFIYLAQEKILPQRKWEFSVEELDKPRMTDIRDRFKQGKAVQATAMATPVGLCLEMKKPGWTFPKRLFFYDPPGESFMEVDKLRPGFDYYKYLRYVIFVIDPFSYPEVRNQFEGRGVSLGNAMVSTMSASDTFTTLLNAMEAKYGKMPKGTVCAVVINKTDIARFKEITGIKPGDAGKSCRAFLEQYDGNLMGLLEENFTKCEYFAVSAQGHSRASSGEYMPEGVENLIEFFLDKM